MTQLITLHLPGSLYQRLTECARQAHRRVEDELMEIVAAVRDNDLPADLSSTLASLPFLDDRALWRATRSRLPAQAVARMQALHDKRDVEGLTAAEQESLAMLPRQNDRSMLVRARAAELLHQRGHDVSSLIESW